ncbi:XrtN system VIT domain protein [Chitinophaga sancti]|uniref:XrtN system VIT domain protein n=2 Tax=Chitinophaga sancti TaxID=1004 RepID=A0A1K1MP75_9BACT|nr:XrtN system VIT domain protein [Chitinophaga sancti]
MTCLVQTISFTLYFKVKALKVNWRWPIFLALLTLKYKVLYFMTNKQYFQMMFRNAPLWVGLIGILVSLGFYFVPELFHVEQTDFFGLFLTNYVFLQLYFVFLWASGNFKRGRKGRNTFAIYTTLCLISCFLLNKSVGIFSASAGWWAFMLALCCINHIAYGFKEVFPPVVRMIMAFILGIASCCFLYLVFCLLPGYLFGAIGGLFFGIGLHVFIPLLCLIYNINLASKYVWFRKKQLYAYLGGIGFVVVVIAFYIGLWCNAVSSINRAYLMPDNEELPGWENVARKTTANAMVERVLKAKLVYQVSDIADMDLIDGIFDRPRQSTFFDARQLHDPLIMIASMTGISYVPETEAAKILSAMFDSRQETQERLWSGDQLSTIQVHTNADIWPSLHMAYTEKTLNVYSDAPNAGSWNSEEAIYRFHLPEGGVVTSLSLWINGREEKGVLTTKEKATEAYKTVVGREARDPGVVHWQEGNTVTVRVFPVSGQESRQFKIGITAPLLQEGTRLVYQNIWFQGPDAANAREDVHINFLENPVEVELPGLFTRTQNTFSSVGPYDADWQISCLDPGVHSNLFSANGQSYFVMPYKPEMGGAFVKTIYLDINQSWTLAEFKAIKNLRIPMKVYAENGWQPATDELFENLQKDRYSLFPVYKVADRETALVITKGNVMSPNLDDLSESTFYKELQHSFGTPGKLLLFNLGGELSPYMRTLKEYRLFRYAEGDVNELGKFMSLKQFPADIENDHRVVIEPAGITINKEENEGRSNAPDHLMRLFAYNHIMQKMGPQKVSDTSLIAAAKESYIVTPVSSLIVLETQKDYDRFNIHDDINSLKNAAIHGKGAVPEPHVWALILIGLVCMLWFKKKRAAAI